MADDKATKALQSAREAISAVKRGSVDQPGELIFEGVRAYSAPIAEVRRQTPRALFVRKRTSTTE